jgi:hypothetical protein
MNILKEKEQNTKNLEEELINIKKKINDLSSSI